MKLVATKALTYGTRRLQAGDRFKASEGESLVLLATGEAEKAPRAAKATVAPEPPVTQTLEQPARLRLRGRRNQGANSADD